MPGRESHHAASAFVHSVRRRSYRSMQPRITPQYTIPVVIGPSSLAVTE